MNTPLVSIIVPIYNRELSISYCIDSILNLTYRNFELILVDDGSTDRSSAICEQYKMRDNRIKLVSQKNCGVSVARNRGISAASGKWITFVDSDDIVLPSHLDILTSACDVDLIMTNRSNGKQVDGKLIFQQEQTVLSDVFVEGQNNVVDYLFGEYNPYLNPIYSCIDKFFRADILKENGLLFHTQVSYGEDQIFVLNYLSFINSFVHHRCVTYLCVSYDFVINHLGSKIRPYDEYKLCILENFKAFSLLMTKVNSSVLVAYAYDYLYDRLISRILFRFRDVPYKTLYSRMELSTFIDTEIRPILREYLFGISYVRKKVIRFFSYLVVYCRAKVAIKMYDIALRIKVNFNKLR